MLVALLLTALALGFGDAQRITFNGERVFECVPRTEEQLVTLRTLWQYSRNVDWWTQPRGVGLPIHVRVSQGSSLPELMLHLGVACSVMIEDLEETINLERLQILLRARSNRSDDDFDYENYHELKNINAWMDSIAEQYSDKVTKIQIGTSFEQRPIYGFKISTSGSKKPAVYIESGIHAREWISTATMLYMTKLLLNSSSDPVVEQIVSSLDWYIVPVVNVDGYTYTWTTNRMWRKTRSTHAGTSCVGVDPNRNWPFHWGEDGAGSEPCSDTYRGPQALSEPEVRSVTEFLSNPSLDVRGFIDFHSFSQLWMYPWAYEKKPAPDASKLAALSQKAVAALEAVHGTKYKYGDIADIIYVASGSSADWAYGAANITYSFGVELRDTGKHGFVLPADEIKPSGEETFAALKQFALFIINN